MSDLRKRAIRLAYQKPELREDLLRIVLAEDEDSGGKGKGKGGKPGAAFVEFIKDEGDRLVKNPNPKGRKDKIKIKSLPQDEQRDIFRKWLKNKQKKEDKHKGKQLSIKKPNKPKLKSPEAKKFIKDTLDGAKEEAKKNFGGDGPGYMAGYMSDKANYLKYDDKLKDVPKKDIEAMENYFADMAKHYDKKAIKDEDSGDYSKHEKMWAQEAYHEVGKAKAEKGLKKDKKYQSELKEELKKKHKKKSALIRLAYANPELRGDLLPIIKAAEEESEEDDDKEAFIQKLRDRADKKRREKDKKRRERKTQQRKDYGYSKGATLRKQVIRLAYEQPELREDLLPLLREAKEFPTEKARKKYLKEHPNADPKNHSVSKSDGGGGGGGEDKKQKDLGQKALSHAQKNKDLEKKLTDKVNQVKDTFSEFGHYRAKDFRDSRQILEHLGDAGKRQMEYVEAGKKDGIDTTKMENKVKKIWKTYNDLHNTIAEYDKNTEEWADTLREMRGEPKPKSKYELELEDINKQKAEAEKAQKVTKGVPEKKPGIFNKIKNLFRKKKASGYHGNMRSFIIRLAYENPELRGDLLPLLGNVEEGMPSTNG